MFDIIVIGGGSAGMIAAGRAASFGRSVVLLEKNEKLGKKLHITGKGRCNITNNTDVNGLLGQIITNPRFLNSAFYTMDSLALMEFFESRGLPLKTERGGRVFPESDKADDVNKTLITYLNENSVKIKLKTVVKRIILKNKNIQIETNGKTEDADAIIIATGGLSYPSTGSTGDGYDFAKSIGHSIIETFPALVPLITSETWVASLEGLSLRNVRCTVLTGGKLLYEETGEMLFMNSGVTGPIIMRASSFLCDKFPDKPMIFIDLKPGLSVEQLDTRILRDFSENQNKNFSNALDELLPKSLIETMIYLSKIPPLQKVNTITREQRQTLVNLFKALPLTPIKTAGFKEAVVTKGGVHVREVNPSTMMSKKQPGIFFAGEILDVDAMTGGYNLQIAFSTGRLAGLSAAKYLWGLKS